MRISLVNVNLVAQDAIGQCILNQWRFFTARGDEVVIYTQHPPNGIDSDVAKDVHVVDTARLISGNDIHFHTSDLYVYHYPSRYALMDTLPGIERGSVILYYHNVTPPELWDNPEERALLRHSLASVSHFIQYADLVVTPSPFNAKDLIDKHGCEAERIRVLPLAVPVNSFMPRPKPERLLSEYGLHGKTVMLFVGRQASNKRVDLLIQALAKVRETYHDAHLLIVGDYQSNSTLKATHAALLDLIRDLGVGDAVTFTGRVDDLPAHYNLADVYITASQHEGFGVPLIEAMASGVPVISSDVTSHPWVLGDAGCLVEGAVPDDYASAVAALLGDAHRMGDLVKKGLARAADFSLERYEAGWYDIVAELTAWMPASNYMRGRSLSSDVASTESDPYAHGEMRVGDVLRLAALRDRVFSMKPAPMPQSGIPVLGKLITWIRRNLTSHVKAEFDPVFHDQRELNREVVGAFYAVQALLEQYHDHHLGLLDAQQSRLNGIDQRLMLMAQEITLLQMRFTLLVSDGEGDAGVYTDLRRDLDHLAQSYQSLRASLLATDTDTKEAL